MLLIDIYVGQNMRWHIYTFAQRKVFDFEVDNVTSIFI